ncbi:unnamed protein product [Musa banksii]
MFCHIMCYRSALERGDEGIDAAVPGCYEFLAAGAAGFLAEPAALVFPSLQRQATSLCGQLQRLAEILVSFLRHLHNFAWFMHYWMVRN